MPCVICAGLQGSDQRYVASVLNRRTKPERVSESLTNSLGFCAQHTSVLQAELEDCPKFRDSAQQAAGWLMRMVADNHVYGERLNEILFRSRGACPACLYRRRLEGRLLARFIRGAPTAKRLLMNYLSGQLCLNHLYAVTPHLLSAGQGAVAIQAFNRTLGRLRRQFKLWDMDGCAASLIPPADFAARRPELAESIGLSCYAGEPCLRQASKALSDCTCVVCHAMREARDQWRLRLARTVELGYPLRLVAPACPTHVVECLIDGSVAVGYAAWSRFLHPDNRPSKAEAAPAAPSRRRKGASWHLARPDPAEPDWEPGQDLAHLGRSCPACSVTDIARMRAVLRFSAQRRSVPNGDIPLCMKHFAEVYILESRGVLRHALAVRRMAALQAQAAHRPAWAFGCFS